MEYGTVSVAASSIYDCALMTCSLCNIRVPKLSALATLSIAGAVESFHPFNVSGAHLEGGTVECFQSRCCMRL